jgi:hypothetical protein
MGVLLSELWKALALPWKLVVIERGRWRLAAAFRIVATAVSCTPRYPIGKGHLFDTMPSSFMRSAAFNSSRPSSKLS